ncbi:MAG: amidohydrolase family protein [Mycobacterium sp.]
MRWRSRARPFSPPVRPRRLRPRPARRPASSTCRAKAQAIQRLTATAATTPAGQWIAAGFFDNLLQGGDLSMGDLDAVSTRHPIFVMYVNGHVGAANTAAFQQAGIGQDVGTLPGGGHFGRGADGAQNGLMYEQPALLRLVALAVPPVTPERIATALTAYGNEAAAAGNTTLHEPGTIKPGWVERLADLSNSLPVERPTIHRRRWPSCASPPRMAAGRSWCTARVMPRSMRPSMPSKRSTARNR